MTIDALLCLDAELAADDLASLARDWRRWRGARRVGIGGPSSNASLTVWRGDMPAMLSLIWPGVYGDFLLTDECLPAAFAGPPPFRPQKATAGSSNNHDRRNAPRSPPGGPGQMSGVVGPPAADFVPEGRLGHPRALIRLTDVNEQWQRGERCIRTGSPRRVPGRSLMHAQS